MSEEKPSNVVTFPGATRLEETPSRVLHTAPECILEEALQSRLREVVVIGVGTDGTFYLGHSHEPKDAMWLIQIAERDLIDDEII